MHMWLQLRYLAAFNYIFLSFVITIYSTTASVSKKCIAASMCVNDDVTLCLSAISPVMRRSLRLIEKGYYTVDGDPSILYREILYR